MNKKEERRQDTLFKNKLSSSHKKPIERFKSMPNSHQIKIDNKSFILHSQCRFEVVHLQKNYSVLPLMEINSNGLLGEERRGNKFTFL